MGSYILEKLVNFTGSKLHKLVINYIENAAVLEGEMQLYPQLALILGKWPRMSNDSRASRASTMFKLYLI